jgi:hypothetical protein
MLLRRDILESEDVFEGPTTLPKSMVANCVACRTTLALHLPAHYARSRISTYE